MNFKTIYDNKVTRKYSVKLERLKEGEKLSIVSDSMFKAMFQTCGMEKYACYLISQYTDYSYEELLENISIVKNELDKENAYKKGLRCDFVADIRGNKINIEVNNNSSYQTRDRNLEYGFRLYSSNINKGSKDDYNTTIQINLNNYAFVGNKKIVDIFTLQNDDNEKLTDKFIVIQIYLANLREKWYTCGIESLSESEKTLLVYIEPSIEHSFEFGKGIDIMEEFIKDAIKASGNEMLLEAYDKEWALKDEGKREGYDDGYSFGYDFGYDSGYDFGYDSGYDSGLDEGINLGIEQGIEQNKIEMIKNMLDKNLDINLITEITGLSIEEITKIKNS